MLPRQRVQGAIARGLIYLYILAFSAPILVMLVFSFNKPVGRFNFSWGEFSLDAWRDPLGVPQLGTALGNSLLVAGTTSLITVVIGTPLAFALGRYAFRGRSTASAFSFLPLATSEVVIGASLLTVFVASATTAPLTNIVPPGLFFPLSFASVVVGHVTLALSFVVVTVRARVHSLSWDLERAARDLGASTWGVYWTVLLPLVRPSVVAGGLLAFVISLDDFVITNFTSGNVVLFPTWLYGLLRRSVPPQIDVVAIIMFGISLLATLAALGIAARAARVATPPDGR